MLQLESMLKLRLKPVIGHPKGHTVESSTQMHHGLPLFGLKLAFFLGCSLILAMLSKMPSLLGSHPNLWLGWTAPTWQPTQKPTIATLCSGSVNGHADVCSAEDPNCKDGGKILDQKVEHMCTINTGMASGWHDTSGNWHGLSNMNFCAMSLMPPEKGETQYMSSCEDICQTRNLHCVRAGMINSNNACLMLTGYDENLEKLDPNGKGMRDFGCASKRGGEYHKGSGETLKYYKRDQKYYCECQKQATPAPTPPIVPGACWNTGLWSSFYGVTDANLNGAVPAAIPSTAFDYTRLCAVGQEVVHTTFIKAASTASTCAMVLTPTVNGGYSRCAEVCSSHNLKCRRAGKISINQNDPEGQCIYQTHPEDPSYEGAWGCYAARDKANTNGHYYCECGENTIAPTPAPTKSPTYPSFRRRFSKCYTPPVYNSGPTQEFVALALKEGKVYGVLNNEQCEWKCQQWPECRAGMNFQGVNGITCLLFPYGISQSAPYACQECGPNQMGWEYEDQCSHTFQKY